MPTSHFSRPILILPSHLRLHLTNALFPSCFPTPISPLLLTATSPVPLIVNDLITLIIFSEEYRSWSFTLCSLLHLSVTSSLLGSNVFLSKHPQPISLPQYDRRSFTLIKNNRQIIFLYILLKDEMRNYWVLEVTHTIHCFVKSLPHLIKNVNQ